MKALADQLIRQLQRGGRWPLQAEAKVHKRIRTWQAFRESDRDALKAIADWPTTGREYKIDPLPELISDAWARHLFGAPPTIAPADERDKEHLDGLLEASDYAAELYRGEDICASEGETWWRILADPASSDRPLIEYHSRASVLPLWIGPRKLGAVAFVFQLEGNGLGGNRDSRWRHFEIHTDGRVENVLFRGTKGTLGQLVPLAQHAETRALLDVWNHGLPGKLAGRVPNKVGRDPRVGQSEYHGIRDLLLDLNEATTIGAENMRLTAKKRAVVPLSALQRRRGNVVAGEDNGDGTIAQREVGFDAGEDVLVANPLDNELGRGQQPFQVLEYSFDAEALIAYENHTAEKALLRIGITPQWVGIRGDSGEGYAATGTALRLRLVPTTLAGDGKYRPWGDAIPHQLWMAMLVDQLSIEEGGYGRSYVKLERPSIERGEPVPVDDVEQATLHQVRGSAGIESRRTAIKADHPDWDDDRVNEELEDIRQDRQASARSILGGENPEVP